MTDVNKAYKKLASAVLIQAIKDINWGGDISKKAEMDILKGGCDLYIDILDLKITKKQFLKRARRYGYEKHTKIHYNKV